MMRLIPEWFAAMRSVWVHSLWLPLHTMCRAPSVTTLNSLRIYLDACWLVRSCLFPGLLFDREIIEMLCEYPNKGKKQQQATVKSEIKSNRSFVLMEKMSWLPVFPVEWFWPINRSVLVLSNRLPALGCRYLLQGLGVKYNIRGLENIQKNHGAVVVINHQSAIDLTGKRFLFILCKHWCYRQKIPAKIDFLCVALTLLFAIFVSALLCALCRQHKSWNLFHNFGNIFP